MTTLRLNQVFPRFGKYLYCLRPLYLNTLAKQFGVLTIIALLTNLRPHSQEVSLWIVHVVIPLWSTSNFKLRLKKTRNFEILPMMRVRLSSYLLIDIKPPFIFSCKGSRLVHIALRVAFSNTLCTLQTFISKHFIQKDFP